MFQTTNQTLNHDLNLIYNNRFSSRNGCSVGKWFPRWEQWRRCRSFVATSLTRLESCFHSYPCKKWFTNHWGDHWWSLWTVNHWGPHENRCFPILVVIVWWIGFPRKSIQNLFVSPWICPKNSTTSYIHNHWSEQTPIMKPIMNPLWSIAIVNKTIHNIWGKPFITIEVKHSPWFPPEITYPWYTPSPVLRHGTCADPPPGWRRTGWRPSFCSTQKSFGPAGEFTKTWGSQVSRGFS